MAGMGVRLHGELAEVEEQGRSCHSGVEGREAPRTNLVLFPEREALCMVPDDRSWLVLYFFFPSSS